MSREWMRAALGLAGVLVLAGACANSTQPTRAADDTADDDDDTAADGERGGGGSTKASTKTAKGGSKVSSDDEDGSGGSGGKGGTSKTSNKGGDEGEGDDEGVGGKGAAGAKAGGGSGQAGKGAGGAAGTAGGAGSAGSTDPAPSDNSAENGYFVSGDWHGWIWPTLVPTTGTASKIDVADFSSVKPAGPWCIKGSVAPSDDYGNSAMIGINLNQDKTPEDAPQDLWTPKSDGVTVSVTNDGKSVLRVQLQDNSDHRWCYTLVGSGGFIKWSDFNTICWESKDKGTAYNKEPISQIMVQVPGGNTAAVDYSYCLSSIADGQGSTQCTPAVGKLSEQYDKQDTTKDCSSYYVIQNNVWGSASAAQTIDYTGTSFSVTSFSGNASTSGAPVSYPSIYVGTNGRASKNSPLPKQVSALSSVTTTWAWTGGSGNYNAAFDVWFDSGTPAGGGTPTGGYLMVWFGKGGAPQPMGSVQWSNVTIGSKQWDVWNGKNGSVPCISYVAKSNLQSWSNFNMLDFIKDAVTKGVLQNSWNLTAVYAGFEIWSGGQGLKTTDFSVAVK